MKAITNWNFSPFVRFDEPEKAFLPYICRISPEKEGFTFEWFDNGSKDTFHSVFIRLKGGDSWEREFILYDSVVKIEGLADLTDYEFRVCRAGGSGESKTRLVRTGKIPGDTVVNYLHPEDSAYIYSGYCLCSPTIVKLPSGKLICGMDVYAKKGGQNLSLLYESHDGGETWRYLNELYPAYWPKLFYHRGALYLLAQTTEYGDLVIGRSLDEGVTWGLPTHLMPGTYLQFGPHHAPMPVIEQGGRLYTSVEYGSWLGGGHDMGYIYADADADLLCAGVWNISPFIRYNPDWAGAPADTGRGRAAAGAGIEGNIVISPDGNPVGLYRMDIAKAGSAWGKALMLGIDGGKPEAGYSFCGIIKMDIGSNSKFCLQYDEVSKKYIAIGTEQNDTIKLRKVLSIAVSDNLVDWRTVYRIFDFSELDDEMTKKIGFQYPDWIFDGEDILLMTRTAYNGAETYHNSNAITFTRIRNFRELIE